jgi:hypothetical protein
VADGSAFRDDILERYDFTPTAQTVLRAIPVEIESPDDPRGGGYWQPDQRRVVLNGAQDEACLHELAHAWADESGFYVDPHPDDRHRLGRNFAFRADVDRAAAEVDPAYRRVAFLAWEYTYGNPGTGFQGMGEADWERFAGLASGVMGDTRLLPSYLARWYAPLFGGHPQLPGPSELPGWAPRGWLPAGATTQLASMPPTLGETLRGWWKRVFR